LHTRADVDVLLVHEAVRLDDRASGVGIVTKRQQQSPLDPSGRGRQRFHPHDQRRVGEHIDHHVGPDRQIAADVVRAVGAGRRQTLPSRFAGQQRGPDLLVGIVGG
jgi:hypothetical protein